MLPLLKMDAEGHECMKEALANGVTSRPSKLA